jgi:hypothetical protein
MNTEFSRNLHQLDSAVTSHTIGCHPKNHTVLQQYLGGLMIVTLVTLLFPFLVSISFIYYLFYVNN